MDPRNLSRSKQAFTNCVHDYGNATKKQMALCVHKNFCMVLILLCRNSLNLPISQTIMLYENKNTHYHSIFSLVLNPDSHSTAFNPHLLQLYQKSKSIFLVWSVLWIFPILDLFCWLIKWITAWTKMQIVTDRSLILSGNFSEGYR